MSLDRNYSEMDIADHFSDYYLSLEDVYGDDVESAYEDFVNILDQEEENYSIMEKVKGVGQSVKKGFKKNLGHGGRLENWISRTGDKIHGNGGLGPHRVFSDMYTDNIYEDANGDLLVEDIYGDLHYADEVYGFMDKVKGLGQSVKRGFNKNLGHGGRLEKWISRTGDKIHGQGGGLGPHRVFSDMYGDDLSEGEALRALKYGNRVAGMIKKGKSMEDITAWDKRQGDKRYQYGVKGGVGALAGAGAGLGTAALVNKFGKNGKRYSELKSKAKLTPAEAQELNNLKSARRRNLILGGAGGAVVGGAAGAGLGHNALLNKRAVEKADKLGYGKLKEVVGGMTGNKRKRADRYTKNIMGE